MTSRFFTEEELERLRLFNWDSPEEAQSAARPETYNPYSPLEEAAPRGEYEPPVYENPPYQPPEGYNPFLARQAQEQQAVYDRNAQQPSTSLSDFGLTALGGISRNLSRPLGGLYGALEAGAPILSAEALQGAWEGLQNPEMGSSHLDAAGVPSRELWGERRFLPDNISSNDVLGGVADLVLDPLNFLPIGRAGSLADAATSAGRAARRATPAVTENLEAPLRLTRRLATEEAGGVRLPSLPARSAGRAAEEAIPAYPAPEVGRQLFGLEDIKPGLTRGERTGAMLSEKAGLGTPDDPIATPAMNMRRKAQFRIQSQAARAAAEMDSVVKQTFSRDALGRIKSIPGNPTIQDVAARRPEYARYLNNAQFKALDRIEAEAGRFRQFLDEVGIGEAIGQRPDIIPGGFYLPRGNALREGAEAPYKVRAGRGGGKAGFQQEASFSSMAEGIDAGFVYSPLRDALSGTFEAMGRKGVDAHVTNYLKRFGDTVGEGVGRESGMLGQPLPAQGWQFSDAIANAVNKRLRSEGELQGAGAAPGRAIQAFNHMLRFSNATGELSMLGIQGVVGMFSDPAAYAKALKLAVRTWMPSGDDVLGTYLREATEKAIARGAPTPAEWAARGGRIAGADTEFTIGRGVGGKAGDAIKRAPVIRQSNSAFGYFGDVLRNEWRDTLWEQAAKNGPVSDQAMEQIARTTNRLSGWSENRAFGSWGEVLAFAPRFLQARIEGVLDTRKLVTGDQTERMIQRRTMLRFLGLGTLMTVAANEALGNETDFRPLVNGRHNSNFMRIRALGRDWTLFGAYDSLLRLAILGGTGDVPGTARSLFNSPAISTAWDLISGEDFVGNATRNMAEGQKWGGLLSSETAQYLGKRPLPFASSNLGTAAGQAGDDRLGALGSAVSAITGVKSSLVTLQEQRDMMVAGWAKGKNLTAKTYRELDGVDRQEFDDLHREITEKVNAQRIDRGGIFGRAEELKQEFAGKQAESDARFQGNEINLDRWAEDYNDRQLELRARRDEVLRGLPDDGTGDIVDRYFKQIDAAVRRDGTVDWEAVDAWRGALSEAEDALIDRSSGIGGTPMVRARRTASRALAKSGYFDFYDNAWETYKAATGDDETVQQAANFDRFQRAWVAQRTEELTPKWGVEIARNKADLEAQSSPVHEKLEKDVARQRVAWIKAHPDLAGAALKYGYLSPGKATLEAYEEAMAH